MRPASLVARVRALGDTRRDGLLAVLLGLEMQVEAALVPADGPTRLLVHAMLLGLAACLAVRRRTPLVALVGAMVVFAVAQGLGREVADHLYAPLFAVLFLTYSAAANLEGRRFWTVPPIVLGAGFVALGVDDYDDSVAGDLLWLTLVFVVGPCVVGRLIRSRSQLNRTLAEKTAWLQRERAEQAQQAVAEERARIAGELHDLVAHALSEMVVQAAAARRLCGGDPEAARGAFSAVEGRGREALSELRQLLGVLRRDDDRPTLTPQPSLRHLESLVRRTRAAGLPVTLRVEGARADVPAGVDVTGYRVVQEALAAALGGRAAGRADVLVRFGPDGIDLEVRDDGAMDGDGSPLPGLRERVALYGGELHALPSGDGGRLVRARLPMGVGR